ncbi:MAG: hypothetical protein J6X33_08605 [Clostridiales bacterium]|nr:hypothetical protein [Clostridiales bacterium]
MAHNKALRSKKDRKNSVRLIAAKKDSWRGRRSKRGGITLFLAIMLAALIFLECTFVTFVWNLDHRLAVNRALKAQVECILADYNRQLFDVYGIYAYSLNEVDDEVFERVLTANGYDGGQELTVYGSESLDKDCIKRAISEYYGYRMPGVCGSILVEQFGEILKELDKYGVIDKLQSLRGSKASEYLAEILSGASKLEDYLSDVDEKYDVSGILDNSDVFDSFRKGLKDDRNDLSDSDIKADLSNADWILDSLNAFSDINSKVSDVGELTGMQLYCAHYAAYNFDCRLPNEDDASINGTLFSDIHEGNEYDTEYLITGINGKAACFTMSVLIHGALSGMEFLKLKQDKKFQAVVKVVAVVLSELIAVISEGSVEIPPKVMEVWLTGFCAALIALKDLNQVEKGEKIAVFKDGDTEFIKVGYRDFMFSFALLSPYPLVMPRILTVLKRDYGDLYVAASAVTSYGSYEYDCDKKYHMYTREAFYEKDEQTA